MRDKAATVGPSDLIQDGVCFRPGETAPSHLRLVFLNVRPGTAPRDAAEALRGLLQMLAALRDRGEVRDLAPRQSEAPARVPAKTFNVLVGYGARFFDPRPHDPPLTGERRPDYLVSLSKENPAFASIPWLVDGPAELPGEADICLQLTGAGEVAVSRAAVEIWKLIEDHSLPLEIGGTFGGFQRDDKRSWIDFHDGLGNIEASQRLAAIEADADPEWNARGTYLAFLRLAIDLAAWRALSREAQEIVVGRDKLTGCPLERVHRENGGLRPEPFGDCPPSPDAPDHEQAGFFDPPQTGDPLVEASHIHRANQNRAAPTTPASQRIFRQGYDYIDSIGPNGPRLGLNFISFQKDLERLQQVLGIAGWLGDVNFGGPTKPEAGEPEPIVLMRLVAGGFYAVPPRREPFPGAPLFTHG